MLYSSQCLLFLGRKSTAFEKWIFRKFRRLLWQTLSRIFFCKWLNDFIILNSFSISLHSTVKRTKLFWHHSELLLWLTFLWVRIITLIEKLSFLTLFSMKNHFLLKRYWVRFSSLWRCFRCLYFPHLLSESLIFTTTNWKIVHRPLKIIFMISIMSLQVIFLFLRWRQRAQIVIRCKEGLLWSCIFTWRVISLPWTHWSFARLM